MATTGSKSTPQSGRRLPVARRTAARVDGDKSVIDETPGPDGAPIPEELPSAAVSLKRALRERDDIQKVLGDRFSAQAADVVTIATMAEEAFATFRPSRLTDAERSQGIYLLSAEGVDNEEARARFETAMTKAQTAGVDKLSASEGTRKLKLQYGDELRNNKELAREGSPDDGTFTLSLAPFVALLTLKLAERPPLAKEPVVTQCRAEAAATDMISRLGGETRTGTDTGTGTGTPGGDRVGDGQSEDGTGQRMRARAFVSDQVRTLTSTVTSPEEKLLVNLDLQRATLANTEKAVDTFQLRAGASDVTSYHDFHSLNLAFDHVWTELFDAELTQLGKALYAEAVKLEQFSLPGQPSKIDPKMTSIADIKQLMARISELSGVIEDSTGGASIDTFKGPPKIRLTFDSGASETVPETDAGTELVIPGATRLSRLLEGVARRIQGNYAFKVFKAGSWNFGFLVTYRQTWTPESYQVGDLVSTLPLAPRETRRYTTRRVEKKTRAAKELEESLRTTRSESAGTSRVEREIVDKAQSRTDFDLTTHGSFGAEGSYKNDYTARAGGLAASQSERLKKGFHEAVLRSAEDYKQQRRMEIDTTGSEETEETTFHEISNPNDELTVTYMFYELQRRYRISERIHQLTPVILLANKVPAPHEIDDAWLTEHDWILRRVILDDSFRPALDYLTKSFVGAELNIKILETNAKAQKKVADDIRDELKAQIATLDRLRQEWATTVDAQAGAAITESLMTSVKKVFDPFELTGKKAFDTSEGMQTVVDFAQETVDRAERERARLIDALAAATNVLQVAIDKLSAAVKEHNERVSEIDRLRLHVKDHIIYYMQAIWSHEPPDQRYFRVFDKKVTVPVADTGKVTVTTRTPDVADALAGSAEKLTYEATMPVSLKGVETKQMSEIADLDHVLGYKGNYAIYPLLEPNYITLSMMLDYLEFSDEVVRLRDPDPLGNYTVAELLELADCVKRRKRDTFDEYAKDFKDLVVKRLLSGHSEDDRVIVPTDSLYLEALVGTHPLLEDFKLLHRSLDVKKVQAEVRRAELENVRLGARALRGKDDDPDIEKSVLVQGVAPALSINPDT